MKSYTATTSDNAVEALNDRSSREREVVDGKGCRFNDHTCSFP